MAGTIVFFGHSELWNVKSKRQRITNQFDNSNNLNDARV
jgi:hypothetical protein